MDKQRLFFQVPYPLGSVDSLTSLWICFQEDLNTKMDKPIQIPSIFGSTATMLVNKDEAEHFMIEVQEYMDILITESYSELMKLNEECVNEQFWINVTV